MAYPLKHHLLVFVQKNQLTALTIPIRPSEEEYSVTWFIHGNRVTLVHSSALIRPLTQCGQ